MNKRESKGYEDGGYDSGNPYSYNPRRKSVGSRDRL